MSIKGGMRLSDTREDNHPQKAQQCPYRIPLHIFGSKSKTMAVSLSLNFAPIKTLHRESYPAISPLEPENNQAGKTVLVTGGAGGIGFAIATAFVQASSSHVIIVGRRQGFLQDGVKRLEAEARTAGTNTKISGYSSDVSSLEASEKLWAELKEDGIVVDVLVLNAVALGPGGALVEANLEVVWKAYEVNVRSLLDHTQRFYNQEGKRQKVSGIIQTMIKPSR